MHRGRLLRDRPNTAPLGVVLRSQLALRPLEPPLKAIGEAILEALDEAGFFATDPEDFAAARGWSGDDVRGALVIIQTFDPPGIAARDLRECLLLQIERLQAGPMLTVQRLVRDHLAELSAVTADALAVRLGVPVDEMQWCYEIIAHLDLVPAWRWLRRGDPAFSPDV